MRDNYELLPNIHLCNIHFIQVDEYFLHTWFSGRPCYKQFDEKPTLKSFIWVCGRHGYEGVLNDGKIEYWDYHLDGLLDKIAEHKEEE